jgi:hypothetical protein
VIDSLLYAAVEVAQSAGYGWAEKTCRVMAEGRPPADCGEWFCAVHQGDLSPGQSTDNTQDEYLDFTLTLTRRVVVPLDRVGDRELAVNLARQPGPNRQPSFNARAGQLINLLRMDWVTIQVANNNLASWYADQVVYGFCEPARFGGMSAPRLDGPEWFGAGPGSPAVGLVSELRFVRARRFMPIADYVG